MKTKTLLLVIILTAVVACSKKEEDPQSSQNGCVSGILNGGSGRVMIDCAKKGDIGKAYIEQLYHDLKWEVCTSCK